MISTPHLIWRKSQGCFHEFGLNEIIRRMIREIYRLWRENHNHLDISNVTKRLAVGAAPKSPDIVKEVAKLGFRHIIDLRAERNPTDILTSTNDVLVHWIPIYDDWRPKSFDFFSNLVTEINTLLANNSGSIFICCGAGEHRAPLAGVLALVIMGYTLDKAMETVQKARPQAEFLPTYISSLEDFLESSNL